MGKQRAKFIDKKAAVRFKVVHRSQYDPLIADENAPKYVLVPVGGDLSKADDIINYTRRGADAQYGDADDDDNDQRIKNETYVDYRILFCFHANYRITTHLSVQLWGMTICILLVRYQRLEKQAQYGVYYDDDYDYMQHLKEVGAPDAVLLEAKPSTKEVGEYFSRFADFIMSRAWKSSSYYMY